MTAVEDVVLGLGPAREASDGYEGTALWRAVIAAIAVFAVLGAAGCGGTPATAPDKPAATAAVLEPPDSCTT